MSFGGGAILAEAMAALASNSKCKMQNAERMHLAFCILTLHFELRRDSTDHDVRMQGFARRHTVKAALAWLDAQLHPLDAEDVPLRAAAGRVLACPVVSDVDVPGFDRATMDGYAVVADSTEGATPYNRIPLKVVGDALPGSPFARTLSRGEAVRIMTGAPMPAGSDAVLPAEFVESGRGASRDAPDAIFAISAVSPGKNIGQRGEDIVRGTTLLETDAVLRPQDIGVMSSIGLAHATRCPQAARAAGHHRQRAAANGLGSRTTTRSPTQTDRCLLPSPNATARSSTSPASCATMRTPFARPSMPTRTSSSCPAARASASKISRPRLWLRMANWPCTASRCDRAARPEWAASASA